MLIRISAKTEYALRAVLELAGAPFGGMLKGEQIAEAQGIPLKFLLSILTELRNAMIVISHRGSNGGFRLARPAQDITVADVVRAVDGLGTDPIVGADRGEVLRDLWVTVERSVEGALAGVTMTDLVTRRDAAAPVPSA